MRPGFISRQDQLHNEANKVLGLKRQRQKQKSKTKDKEGEGMNKPEKIGGQGNSSNESEEGAWVKDRGAAVSHARAERSVGSRVGATRGCEEGGGGGGE